MKKNTLRQLQLGSSLLALLCSLEIVNSKIANASEITIDLVSNQAIQIAQQNKAGKTRVAVLDFDFSAINNPSYLSYFGGDARGVSDILVNQLVKTGKYSVIERSQIEAILQEQDLGASGRVDASTAAQIGRLLGVQTVIFGSVTQMDLEKKQKGGGIFGAGADVTEVDAYVKLAIRMIDTNTGEILSVAEGEGNASQSDTKVRVFGIGGGSSTSNEGKLLTEATEQAIGKVVDSISSSSGAVATNSSTPRPTENALVADIAGDLVILNKGLGSGYREGMKLSIERVSKEIKDPETGEVIRRLTTQVGVIELTDVDGKSSVGKIVSGSNFQVGDVATLAE